MTPDNIRQEKVNELIKSVGMFFAFSRKQFDENKTPLTKDNDVYISIGMGGYMTKSKVDEYINGMQQIQNDFKEAMKDTEERKKYIAYELNNHEAYYTRDITSTMAALGDDFTKQEVLEVFDKRHTIK